MRNIQRTALPLIVLLLSPVAANAWSGHTHFWINAAAAIRAERSMPGWIDYKDLLARLSIGPDIWRGDDRSESPRHYINIEFYGYPENIALDPDNPGIFNERTGTYSTFRGIIPWVIVELIENLTLEMEQDNWTQATRIAGTLGHYIGDIQMPLHVTANFDGQRTGQDGIHARWESEMPRLHMTGRRVPDGNPQYLEDPWTYATNWIHNAYGHVPAVLEADLEATRAVQGDYEDPYYYERLWELTSHIFFEQIEQAAIMLSSAWYTAWVNAGKPDIPPPPASVSKDSIFTEPATVTHGGIINASTLFFSVLALISAWVIWKSIKNKP